MLQSLPSDKLQAYSNLSPLTIQPPPNTNLQHSYHNHIFDQVNLKAHGDLKLHPWLQIPYFLEKHSQQDLLAYVNRQAKKIPTSHFLEIEILNSRIQELEGGLKPFTKDEQYEVIPQAYEEFHQGLLKGKALLTANNGVVNEVSLENLQYQHEPVILYGSCIPPRSFNHPFSL